MNTDDKSMFADGLCGVIGGDFGGVYQYSSAGAVYVVYGGSMRELCAGAAIAGNCLNLGA